MRYFAIMVSSWFLLTVCHANLNDVIHQAAQQNAAKPLVLSPSALARIKVQSLKRDAALQALLENLKRTPKTPQAQKGQYIDGAVLFVSFSMPEPLLYALANEAAVYNIPVVIQGLIDGNFKKTIALFAKLHAQAKKNHLAFNGVSIDPLWFEQFHITAVPALVVSKRPPFCGQALLCQEQTYDVVYGNASLRNSLALIAHKGETAAKIAQTLLEKGHA